MHTAMVEAVEAAGGTVVPIAEASALMFADPAAAASFPEIIAAGPDVEWIQLPYAGIETFSHHLDHDHTWTCGKGVYAPPVAEWIMTALLTAFRDIPRYVRASSWPKQDGKNPLGLFESANPAIPSGVGGNERSVNRGIGVIYQITTGDINAEAAIGQYSTGSVHAID